MSPEIDSSETDETDSEATARRLLDEADRVAERQVAMVRIGLGLALLAIIEIILIDGVPADQPMTTTQIQAAQIISLCLVLVGGLALLGLRLGRPARRLAFATGAADAALVLGGLAFNLFAFDVAGNFFFVYPTVWLAPVALAAAALRYRPALQLYLAVLYIAGLTTLMFAAGVLPVEERAAALAQLTLGFGVPPNGVRLALLAAFALVLALVAWRGRRLLMQTARETRSRLELTRHLPKELASVLLDPAYAELKRGRRQTMALMVVDMRRSTDWAERLEPMRFAVFMSAFRRRIGRAAERHGGVIDKFVGDGALILFGAPDPAPDDAARALACGRELLELIARWNEKRGFDPPVGIGVGVHIGEVFSGVVGDESRLELAVLGEPVSVAARLEQATKRVGAPLLASDAAVAAAGETTLWREVEDAPLPGVGAPVRVMARH